MAFKPLQAHHSIYNDFGRKTRLTVFHSESVFIMRKILIFNPYGIGDVLFTTPLIHNLKEHLANVVLDYICNERVYSIMKDNHFLNKITIYEKDQWRDIGKRSKLEFIKKFFNFIMEIRHERYDVLFDLSMNSKYGFFLSLTGIKKRIGFDYHNRGRFLTDKLPLPAGFVSKHVARYNLELLKFLDITPLDYPMDIYSAVDKNAILKKIYGLDNVLSGKEYIIICPGSGDSWQKTAFYKRWPKEYYLELCRELLNNYDINILVCGSKSELDICKYVTDNLGERCINLCGSLELDEFVPLISGSEFIITNDGGPFHIAQALGKFAFAFFGPVDDKVYGAYPDESKTYIFKKDITCRPCYRSFKFTGCSNDRKCLSLITVKEALNAVASKFANQLK